MELNLIQLIEDLQEAKHLLAHSFVENERLQGSIDESIAILQELDLFYFSSKQKARSIDIGLEKALELRALFKDKFGTLSKIFPTSFAIDVTDINTLLSLNGGEGRLRMYPVYEERVVNRSGSPILNKFSWAFVAENKNKEIITTSVIDVLEPCPPDCPAIDVLA
ncbi:hypothetical protein P1X15_18425 [Runella sp. MFBS21]|uniref:hypothetical protein n=1 Tax=Runella sp. MFBS21 TaxID=3034018 RepID=UPI0023F95C6D|nr:hypothetical protein [Runella sp. MFBS21]MDF7819602.1 hypothetical protein [Runella sp. MFBS21]